MGAVGHVTLRWDSAAASPTSEGGIVACVNLDLRVCCRKTPTGVLLAAALYPTLTLLPVMGQSVTL